jgi:hypothetical protein
MVVDCASGATLVTPDAAKAFGLNIDKTGGSASGVGGTGVAVSTTKVKAFKVGANEEKDVTLQVIDIGYVNAGFKGVGEKPVDGVMGNDWMLAHKALIDLGTARMFVVSSPAK